MDNFVPIPTNLIYMLYCDCLKVLAILIQKESYWDNKGKLKDGWFVKSISELKAELGCANTKDVGCIIAKYTLDESIGETECCKLTKTQIYDRICMANDYFKKGYEEWKANVDRGRTGTHIL